MKSKVVKVGVSSILFFSMILASLALVRPVIGGFAQRLQDYRDQVLSLVEAKTGLRVSYDSLSPAILSAFRIKGIVLSDADRGIPVLSIRKASLSYSISALLSGNLDEAFSKLTVTGITLEYDALQSNHVLEKLMALVSIESAASPGQDQETQTRDFGGGSMAGSPILVNLPFDVDIQDVSLHYLDTMVDVLVSFREIRMEETSSQGFLSASADGQCHVTLQDQVLASLPKEVQQGVRSMDMDFSLDASIMPKLDGSTAGIKLSSIASPAFSLARTSFLAEYQQGVITVSSMQGIIPLSVMAEMDTREGRVRVLAQMDELDPFSFVRLRRAIPLLERVQGTRISGLYEFNLNTKSLDFNYKGNGGLSLPEKLLASAALPGDLVLDYGFSGDKEDILIDQFRVSNQNLDFSLEGSFNIPSFRASGFAFLERFSVPGSGDISAELYIDPLDRGFTCFVPQLYYGDRSFTALQLTMIPDQAAKSFDFEFEASDYSRIDFGMPGLVKVSGSLLNEDKPYLQANLGINDFFIASGVEAASFFVPQEQREKLESLATTLAPYVTTNELYLSTDFSSVSYNVDYWILADTANDDNLLIFSFTGNESTVSISQFDLLFAGQNVQMTAGLDLDEGYSSALFNANVAVNSVPYSFSGSYTNGSWLNVTGDYGLNVTLSLGGADNLLEGQVSMDELPIAFGDAMVLCSLDMNGFVPRTEPADFRVDVSNLSLLEASNVMHTNPRLSMSGQVSSYGFMLDSFLFQDTVSSLDGSGGIMWSLFEGGLDSAGISLSLANPLNSETYSLDVSVTNPTQSPFSQLNLFTDLYFTAQVEVNNLPMARFRHMQNEGNVASGRVTAMGTIDNPYVSIQLDPSSISFGGVPFNVFATARLEDGDIFLDQTEVRFGGQTISDISAHFSLSDFSGSLHAQYDSSLGDVYTIDVPLDISVTSSRSQSRDFVADGGTMGSLQGASSGFMGIVKILASGLPEMISIDANANLGGTFFKDPQPVGLTVVRTPGFYSISSKDDLGISGIVTEEGFINLNLAERMPLHAVVQGQIAEEKLDIQLRNVYSDLSKFTGLVSFPFIMLHGGHLTGNLHIGGILADPEFNGQFQAVNLTINCPDYVPELMIAPNALITFQDNALMLDHVFFRIAKGSAYLDLKLLMDRWMLDVLTLDINTPAGVMVPALVNIPAQVPGAPSVLIDGYSTCDLAIEVTMSSVDVRGRFFVDNVDIDIISGGLLGQSTRQKGLVYPKGSGRFAITLDLGVTTGQHVELFFDPLLRGLIAPNTKGILRYDSSAGTYSIDSDIVLRGGEISYLNRNFYLREGRVVFTENDSLDPIITVRAEIREYDEIGEPVRITLSAENQRLSAFSPTYTSSPPKSEMELMRILGQALTADAQSGLDVLLSGVDYGFQMLVLRKIENALRDFLKFDILSLRTMGLQNSLKQWLNVGGEDNKLTVGNFFDNTTVYIGKYFGSSIYADAMLHFAYDEKKALEEGSESGLIFQPEIGLEMDSPFGTIRWSIAPDIGNMQHLWVPSTSIGISWKFAL